MNQAQYDFDFLVIGAGSGGVRASRIAASLGARVAVVEVAALGGTCVNVGCIPKKLLSHAAHFQQAFHEAQGFGWQMPQPQFDWAQLIANKDQEIHRLNGVYEKLLENAGVTLVRGRAKLVDAHTVSVDGKKTLSAAHILIATGGKPSLPNIPGIEHAITSDEAFYLPQLPKRAVVVGGGYIAVEFASIFNGLGAQTHLVHRGPLLLRHFDGDLSTALADQMAQRGVKLQLETEIEAVEKHADGLHLKLNNGQTLITDCLLYATGRAPNTQDLGLDLVNVKQAKNGAIEVNEVCTTNVPSIHAVGDVIDRVALTPVAIAEGMALAQHLFGSGGKPVNYELVPTAVFSHPNVGTVGLSEAAARKRHQDVEIYKTAFRPLTNRLSDSAESVFLKLVVAGSDRRVVGVHMVGPEAGEMIQGFAVAVQCGATKDQFDATVGIHPTLAEEFVTMRQPSSKA